MDDGAGGIIRRDVQQIARKVGFVHLHLHTSFSLREGALTVANLIKFAKADDQPALAITDTNNLFGALEFSEKVSKEGIQPIIGCQLTVDFGDGKKLGARAVAYPVSAPSFVGGKPSTRPCEVRRPGRRRSHIPSRVRVSDRPDSTSASLS